ncbi:MAG TPA: ATP-binding protein [Microlunatus sp.]|nr:ATP-binding protein [Microlunatus sp.]
MSGVSGARLRSLTLFDGLSDAQVAELASAGTEVPIEPGAVLFTEGHPAEAWWVLLDGSIDLVRHIGREDTVVAQMDVPGRWAGGFRAWDDSGTYLATGRGGQPGHAFRLPAEALRDLFAAWFPFGAHLIGGVYHTARSIESTARQRSSLITLGTLAAGLAHELNNPAAAATRAADALAAASRGVMDALTRLSQHDISATQFAALDALRDELAPQTTYADALERSDREDALQSWMDRRQVPESWRLAAALAGADARPSWCDQVEQVLPGADLTPALQWVAHTVTVSRLLTEVRESTHRVSELVAAVRSYSQMDRASRQRVRVTDGLESTLVMLGHKLRSGIRIERQYASDLPEIEAYPGELNQVWTNLIDNAADALGDAGVLRVGARTEGDRVVVEIADSGPGMPAEVAARAFEPFFTTKEVGRGTGLGLDIARRIVVERHQGSIEIDSVPGNTVIRVRLPL